MKKKKDTGWTSFSTGVENVWRLGGVMRSEDYGRLTGGYEITAPCVFKEGDGYIFKLDGDWYMEYDLERAKRICEKHMRRNSNEKRNEF